MLAGFAFEALIEGPRDADLAPHLAAQPARSHDRDGFTIGVFTGDAVFLVALTAFAGVLGALFLLAVRAWLPGPRSPRRHGRLRGRGRGSLMVRPDAMDFVVLEPLYAIAMFVALPALFGAILSATVEGLPARIGTGADGWLGARPAGSVRALRHARHRRAARAARHVGTTHSLPTAAEGVRRRL